MPAPGRVMMDGIPVGFIRVGYEALDGSSLVDGMPDYGIGSDLLRRQGLGPYGKGPTFRRGIGPGSHRNVLKHKGPTFRPHVTPRGKAPPAHPKHFTTGDVRKAVEGEHPSHISLSDVHTAVYEREKLGKDASSTYLKGERQWIDDELKADRSLHRLLRGVVAHEESAGHRSKVAEALFNRLNLLRKTQPNLTLREYLSRTGENQFYGPLRGTGRDPINEDYLQRMEKYAYEIDPEIDKALGGSNELRGMQDQGGPGDPNYGRSLIIDPVTKEGYGDFGPGGQAYREEQQRRVASGGLEAETPVGVTEFGRKPHGVTRLPGDPNYRTPDEGPPGGQAGGFLGRPQGAERSGMTAEQAGITPEFPTGHANWKDMDAELVARLNEAHRANPGSFGLAWPTAGFRSYEDQKRIYESGVRPAAPAGYSQHQAGLAADISDPSGWLHKNAAKFGLWNLPGDYPHFQLGPLGRSVIPPKPQSALPSNTRVAYSGEVPPGRQSIEEIGRGQTPVPSDRRYQELGGVRTGQSMGWMPTLGQVRTGTPTEEEELKGGGQQMFPDYQSIPGGGDELLGPGHKPPDSYDPRYINVAKKKE
jgi:hypothetical protein